MKCGVSRKLLNAVEYCPSDDPMKSWRNSHWHRWRRKCRRVDRTAARSPGAATQARRSAVPAPPTARASLLVHGTHRSAECLPERDTLLPTGEGRLLPLCRSSMDLLQGFDLSTELSTVLSTLSKSKLKQKRNATEDLKVHGHANTRMCVTCSFLWRIRTRRQVVLANKGNRKGNAKEFPQTQSSLWKSKMTNTRQGKRRVKQ